MESDLDLTEEEQQLFGTMMETHRGSNLHSKDWWRMTYKNGIRASDMNQRPKSKRLYQIKLAALEAVIAEEKLAKLLEE